MRVRKREIGRGAWTATNAFSDDEAGRPPPTSPRLRLRVLVPNSSRSAAVHPLEEQKIRGVNNMQGQSGRDHVLGCSITRLL